MRTVAGRTNSGKSKGGGTTAIRIGKIQTRPGELVGLGPRERADSGLQWAARAIGIAVIKDAITGADGCAGTACRIPSEAHAWHELLVIHGGDAGGHARVARE